MMFNLAIAQVGFGIRRCMLVSLIGCAGLINQNAESAQTDWFPDPPNMRHYAWTYEPCPGCESLIPRPEWSRMAMLAGLPNARFVRTPDESGGTAYSAAPNVVVLAPSTLRLEPCQLAFVIGHEIVHIAQRHFDEDAIALSVYSGKPAN